MSTGLQRSPILLVAGGGALGAGVRWAVLEALDGGGTEGLATTAAHAAVDGDLPWGLPWPVVLVNLIGCVLLGVLLGRGADNRMRLLVGTGFCGGLTTFSTFAVDAAELWRDARPGAAATYAALSVVLGLGAFLAGRRLAGAGR